MHVEGTNPAKVRVSRTPFSNSDSPHRHPHGLSLNTLKKCRRILSIIHRFTAQTTVALSELGLPLTVAVDGASFQALCSMLCTIRARHVCVASLLVSGRCCIYPSRVDAHPCVPRSRASAYATSLCPRSLPPPLPCARLHVRTACVRLFSSAYEVTLHAAHLFPRAVSLLSSCARALGPSRALVVIPEYARILTHLSAHPVMFCTRSFIFASHHCGA